jgi:protein gp37
MAEATKIQWTDSTFNPWRGCTKIASGCANCYAETLAKRNPGTLGIWGPNGKRVLASDKMWREPVKWNAEAAKSGEQHRVFCASLADIFEDWKGEIVDAKGAVLVKNFWERAKPPANPKDFEPLTLDDVRVRLFKLIDATPNLTWQILTKRPQNIRKMWPCPTCHAMTQPGDGTWGCDACDGEGTGKGFRKNVHLLYSASDQESLEAGIGELLKCRDLVPVLGLSLEPLVGPIDLSKYLQIGRCKSRGPSPEHYRCGLPKGHGPHPHSSLIPTGSPWFGLRELDWVIVGGESGHGARPCNVAWIRSIVRQCKDAGVPCFVKQLGTLPESENDADAANSKWTKTKFALNTLMLNDMKGGDWDEWPEDLRVREFPGVTRG